MHQFRENLTLLPAWSIYIQPKAGRIPGNGSKTLAHTDGPQTRGFLADNNNPVVKHTRGPAGLSNRIEERVQDDFRTSDGMFVVSSDQKITAWNATAEKLLGYRQDQAIGKKCYDLLSANENPGRIKCNRSCTVVINAAKGRTTRDFDLECLATDGTLRQFNMSILLVGEPGTKPNERRVLHLFREVTARRRVEQASAAASRSHPSGKANSSLTPPGYRLPPLTTREDQVLKLLAAGKNTADISEILAIRPLTARNHVSRLLTKLGCRSRLEAVALGTRAGLV